MWLIAASVQVCGIVVRNTLYHPAHVWAIFALAMIAELAVLALMLLVRWQRSPGGRLQSMTPGQVILFWIGCGVLLTVIMELGIDLFIGGGGLGIGVRLAWTTGSTLVLFGVATVVGAGVVEQQADLVRLRLANERILLLKAESRLFAEDQHRLLADALDATVIPELERLAEEAEELARTSRSDLEPLQARVAFYSETIIRSLSREVAGIAPTRPQPTPAEDAGGRFTIGGLLQLLMTAKVRLLPSVAFMGVVLWSQIVPSCAPRDALIMASGVIVFLSGQLVVRLIRARSPRAAGIVNVLIYPALLASFVWSARSPIVACRWEGSSSELILVASVGVVCLALLAMALQVRRRSMEDALNLASRIRVGEAIAAELDRAGERMRDQVSLVLHGSVQGRLTAVSLALRTHIDEVKAGGHPDQRQLLERVTLMLERALEDVQSVFAGESPPESIDTRMQVMKAQWLGLLDISWGVSPRAAEVLGADPDCAAWVYEILGEAITNASRHGGAGSIHLRIDVDHETGGWLVISAIDDGAGPTVDLREGLGTERVRARGGSWALAPGPEGGSRMTVTFPIRASGDEGWATVRDNRPSAPWPATMGQQDAGVST
jgi:signal transduction histidine kinase